MPLPAQEPLNTLLRKINEDLSSALRVQDLAEIANLSVRQVERMFRNVLGMTPKQYIIKTRVHAAARLLLSGDLPLHRIALETGFCDQSALTYYFRRELGISPGKFRRAALSGSGSTVKGPPFSKRPFEHQSDEK